MKSFVLNCRKYSFLTPKMSRGIGYYPDKSYYNSKSLLLNLKTPSLKAFYPSHLMIRIQRIYVQMPVISSSVLALGNTARNREMSFQRLDLIQRIQRLVFPKRRGRCTTIVKTFMNSQIKLTNIDRKST